MTEPDEDPEASRENALRRMTMDYPVEVTSRPDADGDQPSEPDETDDDAQ
jgi:hypothetical protein